ncbi:MAG: non-canonical purine NTP pyrophosphatase [Bernardetiaceae bacterium]|nr:non-canonical purine NTP pyrophosphatase [Bernardetiaceae bacterium]
MKNLCFASRNAHKRAEIQHQLGPALRLLTLDELGLAEEIPENEPTIEGNSWFKAHYVWQKTGIDCFADDTGLEVDALGGAPGVHTAYYGGPERSADKNIGRLLAELAGVINRRAQFKTVITLYWGGQPQVFTGLVPGQILLEPRGQGGFGYDPIFLPDEGQGFSLAQMDMATKNQLSHRGRAVRQLVAFLRQENSE